MKMVRYKIGYLKIMRDSLLQNKISLAEKLSKIDSALVLIDNCLGYDKNNINTEILLPENLLDINFNAEVLSSIKWIDELLELLRLSEGFMSANSIYEALRMKYPIELSDRRKSVKTISSSLLALLKEGKVGRITDDSGKFIFGNSSTHFTSSGLPNKLYIEKKQL